MSNGVQERQPTGWTVFAGMLLVIVGSLDALWGLAGILNDQVVVVGGHGTIVADVTTWGWVHLFSDRPSPSRVWRCSRETRRRGGWPSSS